jgi:hypothetical protein
MSKPQPVAVETPKENEISYEQSHVHDVYEVIATHFSDTRYKASRSNPFFLVTHPLLLDLLALACR